ncbi:YggT family protein [Acetobacter sp. LMG 1636]|uniref:YggT family protein n=1 Tax=Acetobacter fallax TaxID=1737473 RepID=A0ABX0KCT9_9PROT|nr:YggT family protein [Acetobacter fallax]NHO32698.1 YggT family protein [Acetobacter fallax]NHO36242.1 YggT family protein [Acetobacter fallax]
MFGLCRIILTLLNLYEGVVFVYCIFSMLYSFGILDAQNRIVWQIGNFLNKLVEPVLNPIRRIMPSLGNVDLSPLILLLGLQYLVQPLVVQIMVASLTR